MKQIVKFFCLLFTVVLSGCRSASTKEIPAVKDFNAEKYMGRWYEIARLPNYFEKDLHCVTADYTLLPSGKIQVRNCGVKQNKTQCIQGTAKFRSSPDQGDLLVSFWGPFYNPYRIVYLAPDYSLAIVTGSRKNYFWILSRTPQIPASQLKFAIEFARKHNFEVEKLIYPQPVKITSVGK